MRDHLRHELRTLVVYFLIALAAETAGFIGWMNEMTKGGNVFQLSSAFWSHEVSRLRIWLPVFLGLSILRLLFVLVSDRVGAGKRLGVS